MAEPPLRDLVFWCRNDVTVDTGAGVDVRRLDDANGGATDSSQTCTATHTQDGALRTFDPATAGVTASTDVLNTLQKTGWALPMADITPVDTRCRARLPAGGAVLDASLTVARNAVPLISTTGVTLRASLWRYNPTADTGTFIASSLSSATTFDLVLNVSQTKTLSLFMTWASDVVFERPETLYLQIGVGCGTMGDPLTGTITYTFTLGIDNVDAGELTFDTAPLNAKCDLTGSAGAALSAAHDSIAARRRTFPAAVALNANFDRTITGHRTFTAGLALNGIFGSVSQLHRTFIAGLTLNAQRAIRRTHLAPKAAGLTLAGAEAHRLVLRRQRSASLHLNAQVSVAIRKTLTAALHLNGQLARFLRLQRTFAAGLTLNGRLSVVLAQHILGRLAGGAVTVVRKIFPISD